MRSKSTKLALPAVAATLAACGVMLCSATVRVAVPAELSPQCQSMDFASAQSIFECVGTIRHSNGSLKFSGMDRGRCAEFIVRLARETGQSSLLRDPNRAIPSCEVVAEVSEMVTGKKPNWGDCTGYPSPSPDAHMRKCMETFAPAYFGPRYEAQIGTCEGYLRGYELALKSANNRHNQQVPENYVAPSCDAVNSTIGAVAGDAVQWPGCMNYDPAAVQEHLLACVADSNEFLQLRDCVAVRAVYEQRLRATHGGLPGNYSILSCNDAQVVLDKAIAYEKEREARRVAQSQAAEEARREAAERQRRRVEEARAAIRARQRGEGAPTACDPGPNRYPDQEYGGVRSSLEAGCAPTLSADAQLFAAALAEGLARECGLPRDPNDRLAVAKFVSASIPVGIGGHQYGNPDVGAMISDQVASHAAYAAGAATFNSLDSCDDQRGIRFADGLARYLRQTASRSRWVDGCELQYATLYSRAQCQCMADAIRGFDPGIHSREYSRDAIKGLIGGNPLAATRMALECGISDY